ncbi:hypothetical protein BGZ54_002457 [Gamsiella multidivaricata]|nr:hypothetical protein BGZ54_002457 [Gamsiella multidivaricata]
MVDFGLFSGAIQLALVINEMARAAQANKVSCHAMDHRIQIANEIIKAAFEQYKVNPKSIVISESAFKMYFQLLERMRDFVAEISKRKTFSKLFYALRFRDEFDALLRDFDSCVLDLNLGIALRTQSQLETDRNALEEDMVELRAFRKELQSGVECLGGQLMGIRQMIAQNRPMDDILAQVEIDYRQIVDITPGETRKGRTFPVHKRSWLAQEVAEKPLGFFGSQDMLDMLKNEIAILKKLDRCNYITKFMGVTNRNNQISIIMEWLPGGDLATALSKGDMDWEQKLFVAADIARGLQFLHEVGIIHKTLRAKNILLTRHGQAKITNFRQSRLESAQTRPMSDPFSFVRWLAPEKMTHKDVRYGAECDIYSFGMLLFEIASNKIPYIDYTDRQLPELIVLKPLYETVPERTPLEFANIMTACWSHDPRLRPTVSQVLLILRDACVKFTNGQEKFGGLPTSMKDPAPLFAMSPPSPMMSQVYPISPPMTPITPKTGLLTPEVWNNPYVNKQYVEESMEEMRQAQQRQALGQGQAQVQGHAHAQQPLQSQPLQSQPLQSQQPQLQQQQRQQQVHHQHQSPRLQQQHIQQQSPRPQMQSFPSHSQLPQVHQTPAPKQEYAGSDLVDSNGLSRTARPQLVSFSSAPTQGSTRTPIAVTFPSDTQVISQMQANASASPVASRPTDSPPLVNRNTRPSGIKPKKISKSLEEQMSRLSLQGDGKLGSPALTEQNTGVSPQSSIKRTESNNNMFNSGGSSDGSISSGQTIKESIRPRSTSLATGTPINTLPQALLLHEGQERDKAWKIFKVYSDQGNPEGMYWTGYYLFHGEGGQVQNRQAAFELFRAVTFMELAPELQRLASNAHFYTAVCYLEGQGVERNHVTGFGHMEMAANSGNAFAQYLVGDAYHKGSAVVQANVQKRNHYWQLAARQKEQRAMMRYP